jgi:hypothetical protein
MRQHDRLADQAAAHLEEIADVDELEPPVEAKGSDRRQLRILVVERVDLVQRGLDGETIVPIDRRRPAEDVVK